MDYRDTYAKYYRQIPGDIEKLKASQRQIVLGYASDLDVIMDWDTEAFAHILSAYLKEEPGVVPGDAIDSIEAFARIVSHYMIHGLGGEIDITDSKVCEYLEQLFNTTYALGGTCAQGAAALNAVGFPVLAYITDRSPEVCRQMSGPGLATVDGRGIVPMMESATDEPPVRHMILQYPKGVRFSAGAKTYEAPVSNRMIMDYDHILKTMPVTENFLKYCEAHAAEILVYCVSGFNGIIEEGIMSGRMDEMSAHYARVKQANPACMIYLESACYMNAALNDLVLDRLSGIVDIYGMNEEELVDHTKRYGVHTDKEDLESVLGGLSVLMEKYRMRGIVLHSKDYAIYYGEKTKGADFEKGLTLGNLMAATRARTGRYGSYSDCGETMRIALSPKGLRFAGEAAGAKTKAYLCVVPARYMEQPKYTIGLGDTFMAGFLTTFVR